MRTVACILPSDPSSACPTVPRPSNRPSVAPFCLSKAASTAVSLTGAPSVSDFGTSVARSQHVFSHHESEGRPTGPLPTRLDGIAAQARAERIHPAMPFARKAAPLVRDRAPLVLLQVRERALVRPPAGAGELAVGHDRAPD